MTDKRLISIIIPVYNAESTLEQTIQSALKQKSNLYELEILLINDGSKDDSEKICRRLASEDSCIKVYSKENGGVSSARNYGLCRASGEFYLFADADDLLLDGMLETLYRELDRTGADLAWSGYEVWHDNRKLPGYIPEERLVTGQEQIRSIVANLEIQCTTFVGAPWGKLFRSKIIERHQLRFPENTCFGEDFCFDADYFEQCSAIVFIAKAGYLYNMREVSLATHFSSDSIGMYTFLWEKKMRFYQAYQDTIHYINTAYVEKMIACFGYILNCKEIRKEEYRFIKEVAYTESFQNVLQDRNYDICSRYVRLMIDLCRKKKIRTIYIISKIKEVIKR